MITSLELARDVDPRNFALLLLQRLGNTGIEMLEKVVRARGLAGISGGAFIHTTLRCLAYVVSLPDAPSYPWQRKCTLAADGSRCYEGAELVGGFLPDVVVSHGGLNLADGAGAYAFYTTGSKAIMRREAEMAEYIREIRRLSDVRRSSDAVAAAERTNGDGSGSSSSSSSSSSSRQFTRSATLAKLGTTSSRSGQALGDGVGVAGAPLAGIAIFESSDALCYALAVLYHEIDENQQDRLQWEEIAAFFAAVSTHGALSHGTDRIGRYYCSFRRDLELAAPVGSTMLAAATPSTPSRTSPIVAAHSLHSQNKIVAVTESNEMFLVDSNTLETRRRLPYSPEYGRIVQLSVVRRPGEVCLVAVASTDCKLRLLADQHQSRQQNHRHQNHSGGIVHTQAFGSAQTAVRFIPEMRALLCGARSGIISMLTVHQGSIWRASQFSSHHQMAVTDFAFMPSRQHLAVSMLDGGVQVYDADSSAPIALAHHGAAVRCMDHSSFYDLLAVGGDEGMPKLYVPTDPRCVSASLRDSNQTHRAAIQWVHFQQRSPQFFSVDVGGVVKLWDVRNFQCVQTIHHEFGHQPCGSSDGRHQHRNSRRRSGGPTDAPREKPVLVHADFFDDYRRFLLYDARSVTKYSYSDPAAVVEQPCGTVSDLAVVELERAPRSAECRTCAYGDAGGENVGGADDDDAGGGGGGGDASDGDEHDVFRACHEINKSRCAPAKGPSQELPSTHARRHQHPRSSDADEQQLEAECESLIIGCTDTAVCLWAGKSGALLDRVSPMDEEPMMRREESDHDDDDGGENVGSNQLCREEKEGREEPVFGASYCASDAVSDTSIAAASTGTGRASRNSRMRQGLHGSGHSTPNRGGDRSGRRSRIGSCLSSAAASSPTQFRGSTAPPTARSRASSLGTHRSALTATTAQAEHVGGVGDAHAAEGSPRLPPIMAAPETLSCCSGYFRAVSTLTTEIAAARRQIAMQREDGAAHRKSVNGVHLEDGGASNVLERLSPLIPSIYTAENSASPSPQASAPLLASGQAAPLISSPSALPLPLSPSASSEASAEPTESVAKRSPVLPFAGAGLHLDLDAQEEQLDRLENLLEANQASSECFSSGVRVPGSGGARRIFVGLFFVHVGTTHGTHYTLAFSVYVAGSASEGPLCPQSRCVRAETIILEREEDLWRLASSPRIDVMQAWDLVQRQGATGGSGAALPCDPRAIVRITHVALRPTTCDPDEFRETALEAPPIIANAEQENCHVTSQVPAVAAPHPFSPSPALFLPPAAETFQPGVLRNLMTLLCGSCAVLRVYSHALGAFRSVTLLDEPVHCASMWIRTLCADTTSSAPHRDRPPRLRRRRSTVGSLAEQRRLFHQRRQLGRLLYLHLGLAGNRSMFIILDWTQMAVLRATTTATLPDTVPTTFSCVPPPEHKVFAASRLQNGRAVAAGRGARAAPVTSAPVVVTADGVGGVHLHCFPQTLRHFPSCSARFTSFHPWEGRHVYTPRCVAAAISRRGLLYLASANFISIYDLCATAATVYPLNWQRTHSNPTELESFLNEPLLEDDPDVLIGKLRQAPPTPQMVHRFDVEFCREVKSMAYHHEKECLLVSGVDTVAIATFTMWGSLQAISFTTAESAEKAPGAAQQRATVAAPLSNASRKPATASSSSPTEATSSRNLDKRTDAAAAAGGTSCCLGGGVASAPPRVGESGSVATLLQARGVSAVVPVVENGDIAFGTATACVAEDVPAPWGPQSSQQPSALHIYRAVETETDVDDNEDGGGGGGVSDGWGFLGASCSFAEERISPANGALRGRDGRVSSCSGRGVAWLESEDARALEQAKPPERLGRRKSSLARRHEHMMRRQSSLLLLQRQRCSTDANSDLSGAEGAHLEFISPSSCAASSMPRERRLPGELGRWRPDTPTHGVFRDGGAIRVRQPEVRFDDAAAIIEALVDEGRAASGMTLEGGHRGASPPTPLSSRSPLSGAADAEAERKHQLLRTISKLNSAIVQRESAVRAREQAQRGAREKLIARRREQRLAAAQDAERHSDVMEPCVRDKLALHACSSRAEQDAVRDGKLLLSAHKSHVVELAEAFLTSASPSLRSAILRVLAHSRLAHVEQGGVEAGELDQESVRVDLLVHSDRAEDPQIFRRRGSRSPLRSESRLSAATSATGDAQRTPADAGEDGAGLLVPHPIGVLSGSVTLLQQSFALGVNGALMEGMSSHGSNRGCMERAPTQRSGISDGPRTMTTRSWVSVVAKPVRAQTPQRPPWSSSSLSSRPGSATDVGVDDVDLPDVAACAEHSDATDRDVAESEQRRRWAAAFDGAAHQPLPAAWHLRCPLRQPMMRNTTTTISSCSNNNNNNNSGGRCTPSRGVSPELDGVFQWCGEGGAPQVLHAQPCEERRSTGSCTPSPASGTGATAALTPVARLATPEDRKNSLLAAEAPPLAQRSATTTRELQAAKMIASAADSVREDVIHRKHEGRDACGPPPFISRRIFHQRKSGSFWPEPSRWNAAQMQKEQNDCIAAMCPGAANQLWSTRRSSSAAAAAAAAQQNTQQSVVERSDTVISACPQSSVPATTSDERSKIATKWSLRHSRRGESEAHGPLPTSAGGAVGCGVNLPKALQGNPALIARLGREQHMKRRRK